MAPISSTSCRPTLSLADTVGRGCGANVCKCYQCKRCSNGCPVAPYADMHPSQIMRAIQLGQVDLALGSKFIWLCTSCQTCTTRCPQSIDVAAVMDELRIISRREGCISREAALADVLRLNAKSIQRWGRLYEIELVTEALLSKPKVMRKYIPIGRHILARRKIRFLPETGDRKTVKRMLRASERILLENPTALEQARNNLIRMGKENLHE